MAESNSTIQPEQTDEVSRVLDEVQIARNIINQCNKTVTSKTEPDFQYYTGIQETEDIAYLFKKESKSFSDWLHENCPEVEHRVNITYKNLRQAIYTEYIERMRIPTRERIKTNLNNKNVKRSTLDLALKYQGFVWKQLAKTNKYILTEKADQMARRVRYLYEMKQIRDVNKTVVYVEVHTTKTKVKTEDHDVIKQIEIDIAVAVSPQIGLIDVLVKKTEDLSVTIDSWLNDNLYKLPVDTVFVMEPFSKLLDEMNVPDKHSTKSEMIKWLSDNNVPFSDLSHSGELYTLIEIYKGRHKVKIESFNLLMAKNYKVIIRPRQLSYKRYFKLLWIRLNILNVTETDLVKIKAEYLELLNDVDNQEWSKNEIEMATFEMAMLEEDKKFELIIDKLMESVQNKSLDLSDLEDCEENCVDNDYIDSILVKG